MIGTGTHLHLDVGAVAIAEQVVTQARQGHSAIELASALNTLGVRLGSVGRRPEALSATEDAVGLYREVVGLNREAYLAGLVRSLVVQGTVRFHHGEPGKAVDSLYAALVEGEDLAQHDEELRQIAVSTLRSAHHADPHSVESAWQEITQTAPPAWLTSRNS